MSWVSGYILPPPDTILGCSNTNHLSICSYKLKCTINLCCALGFTCSMLSSNKICASPSGVLYLCQFGYLLCLHQHRLEVSPLLGIGILSSISKLVELTVVVVPSITKLPVTRTSPIPAPVSSRMRYLELLL